MEAKRGFWDKKVIEILLCDEKNDKWEKGIRVGIYVAVKISCGYYLCNLFDHHWIFHEREVKGEFPESTSRKKWPLARQRVITLDSVLQQQMKARGRAYLHCDRNDKFWSLV